MQRIVLAYSGGIVSTAVLARLIESRDAEIVAVTLDLGQGGALEEVRDRALAGGARRAHVLDLRDEFAGSYVLPALKADVYGGDPLPMTVELTQPLIAAKVVEVAAIEQAGAVAHGYLRAGSASIETAVRSLNPGLAIIAPEPDVLPTRERALEYARSRGLTLAAGLDSPLRIDANLWGRSVTWTSLEEPLRGAPAHWTSLHYDDLYVFTRPLDRCADHPASIEIKFEQGTPVAINGVPMSFVELIASLSMIAGAHGIGRFNRVMSGVRKAGDSEEIREAPAAVALQAAHEALIAPRLGGDVRRQYAATGEQYADLLRRGLWFTPARAALDAFIDGIHEDATGTVKFTLSKGSCTVVDPGVSAASQSVLTTADTNS